MRFSLEVFVQSLQVFLKCRNFSSIINQGQVFENYMQIQRLLEINLKLNILIFSIKTFNGMLNCIRIKDKLQYKFMKKVSKEYFE